MAEYEIVKGFQTKDGLALYDYDSLYNKPIVVKTVNNISPDELGNVQVTVNEESGFSPTVEATQVEEGVLITITNQDGTTETLLPKGEKGESGVYIGSGEMPEGYNVQIDPDGDAPLPYYKPRITQTSSHVIKIEQIPSEDGLQEVEPVEVILPDTINQTVKTGLTVAIIGDSISTFKNKNAYEIVITEEDVGKQLFSYITHYDVYKDTAATSLTNKTISKDGINSNYLIQPSDIGTQLSFIPSSEDVGKKIGIPKNYNDSNDTEKTWWQVAADHLGFEPIVASWSGSSITSHEATESYLKCAHAWHDHTIRKIGKRIPGTTNRIAPDVVLIYRGTNDLSHSDKVRLTSNYYNTVNWDYPSTDALTTTTYGYQEGLALTIQKIRKTYPNTKIVLCTCNVFKRKIYSSFPTRNNYFSLPQMNNAIRQTADFFGCHLIELDKCGITWENCYSEGYITDSSTKPTHPNTKGHQLMGKQAISDLLNRLHILDIEHIEDVIIFENTETEPEEPEVSTNIAILGTYMEGYYVKSGSGELAQSASYFIYKDVPIEAGAIYNVPYCRNYAFYDENGATVKAANTITDDGFTTATLSEAFITSPTGAVTLTATYRVSEIAPEDVTITKREAITEEPEEEINLISTGVLIDNCLVASKTGFLDFDNTVYFVYVVPVKEAVTYSIPEGRNYMFYDVNPYIDGIYNSEATILSSVGSTGSSSSTAQASAPIGASYLAVTYKYADIDPQYVVIKEQI